MRLMNGSKPCRSKIGRVTTKLGARLDLVLETTQLLIEGSNAAGFTDTPMRNPVGAPIALSAERRIRG